MSIFRQKLSESGNIVSYRLEIAVSNAGNKMLPGDLVELIFDKGMGLLGNNKETVFSPGLDKGERRTENNLQAGFRTNLLKKTYEDGRTFAYVANTGTLLHAFTLSKS